MSGKRRVLYISHICFEDPCLNFAFTFATKYTRRKTQTLIFFPRSLFTQCDLFFCESSNVHANECNAAKDGGESKRLFSGNVFKAVRWKRISISRRGCMNRDA
jgi:hypothetical protein